MVLENLLSHLPPTLTQRWNIRDYGLGPSQAMYDDASDFMFSVAASHNEPISMAVIRFLCSLVITRLESTPLAASLNVVDDTPPINNIIYSLLQSITVKLGDEVVSDTAILYHIHAYGESLLYYRIQTQRSQFTCANWQSDTNLQLSLLKVDKKIFA